MAEFGQWVRTGDCRIVPWWFGIMRAEFMERRERPFPYSEEIDLFQIRWVSAGRLPAEFDGPGAFGFWSTLATPPASVKPYGDRALWRRFISYWKAPT